MTKVTSIRLDDRTASRLDELAASLDRPKAWIIEQALTAYLDEQSWQIRAISEALEEYRAGEATLIPHEQVRDHLGARLRTRS